MILCCSSTVFPWWSIPEGLSSGIQPFTWFKHSQHILEYVYLEISKNSFLTSFLFFSWKQKVKRGGESWIQLWKHTGGSISGTKCLGDPSISLSVCQEGPLLPVVFRSIPHPGWGWPQDLPVDFQSGRGHAVWELYPLTYLVWMLELSRTFDQLFRISSWTTQWESPGKIYK